MERRSFIITTVLTAAAGVTATACTTPRTPFGALKAADANGWQLPAGFTSRVVATTGKPVGTTGYVWHGAPDGAAVIPWPGGGWAYVSNSELPSGTGGASMIRFNADGTILSARRLLAGTTRNCSGGATSWGTYISCEEVQYGRVYEVFPLDSTKRSVRRDALGWFQHEGAACDPDRRHIYMTEDQPDGCVYRFTPAVWGDLSRGRLAVLAGPSGSRRWATVNPNPQPGSPETRHQIADAVRFACGEGCYYAGGHLYVTTKLDDRVWRINPGTGARRIMYDGRATGGTLNGVDQCVMAPSGDLVVVEDGGNYEVVMVGSDGRPGVIARLTGLKASELTGVAFAPNGRHLYVASQWHPGRVYAISGDFRRTVG